MWLFTSTDTLDGALVLRPFDLDWNGIPGRFCITLRTVLVCT